MTGRDGEPCEHDVNGAQRDGADYVASTLRHLEEIGVLKLREHRSGSWSIKLTRVGSAALLLAAHAHRLGQPTTRELLARSSRPRHSGHDPGEQLPVLPRDVKPLTRSEALRALDRPPTQLDS